MIFLIAVSDPLRFGHEEYNSVLKISVMVPVFNKEVLHVLFRLFTNAN